MAFFLPLTLRLHQIKEKLQNIFWVLILIKVTQIKTLHLLNLFKNLWLLDFNLSLLLSLLTQAVSWKGLEDWRPLSQPLCVV